MSVCASVRALPYPFKAMLAICSDLDETPDRRVYRDITRYLNTTDTTSMGPGVGLEVGNSIYFDMPRGQFSYWNTDDAGRAMVRDLIRSRHIDCLHSFGDLATTRRRAGAALDELSRHGCRLEVWVDHATAPTNFGADIMRGSGDVPGAEAYHADLTHGYGVRYVWRGRVTSVTGQGVPRRLAGVADGCHPLESLKTLAKEFAKGTVARAGSRKYSLHAANCVLRPATLRSGHRVYEFLRSNPHWGGVSRGDTATGLAEVITPRMLQRLMARRAACILYTHLGKIVRTDQPFSPATRQALVELARLARTQEIRVTTTRRLLGYYRALQHVEAKVTPGDECDRIDLRTNAEIAPADLQGLTVYVPDPARARVWRDGREVTDVNRNPPDDTGRASISLPWTPLEFPPV